MLGPNGARSALEVRLWVHLPSETPAGSTIRVKLWGKYSIPSAGSQTFAWTQELDRGPDGRFTTRLLFAGPAEIEFHFSRGDVESRECGPQGQSSPERRLRIDAPREVELWVARWCDLGPARTKGPRVSEHRIDSILDGRRFWVYLPPDYEGTDPGHPVLYMLDGQNLFDDQTSFAGEWRVDEICDDLIAAGRIQDLIVVGVDNGGERRLEEYSPWPDARMARGGGGVEHLRAIVEELKPWIDGHYRIEGGAASTGFAGSSLGGLMALYVAREYTDVFARVGALSPSLWWDGGHILEGWDRPPPSEMRLWIDMGTREGTPSSGVEEEGPRDGLRRLRKLRLRLLEAGFVESDQLRVVEIEGGEHHEGAWSARLPELLQFLFPALDPESRPTREVSHEH